MKHSNPFHPLGIFSVVRCYSRKFNSFTKPIKRHPKFLTSCTFTLRKGELFRISSTIQEVKVLSGLAWLTVAGKDIILQAGEKASIRSDKDIALVSALGEGDVSLVLTAS